MDTPATETTLRDTIAQAVDSVESAKDPGEVTAQPTKDPADTQEVKAAVPAEPTEDRPRGPDGKFVPKETAPVEAPKPRQRPSTWKKELWEAYDKLDPQVAEYILERENQYTNGVSTYKKEWERAQPLLNALAPFMPDLEKSRIAPDQFVTNLASAHRALAYGTPEQKMAMFQRLANDYGVPLQSMFQQGQDGRVYFTPPQPQPQQGITPDDVNKIVQERLMEQTTQHEVTQFKAAKDANGQPLHPHFEAVKDTMAGLLQAGLADDLQSAYQASIRMPKHADIFEAQQRQQREAEEKRIAEEKAKEAQRARRNAVSTRSATPTGAVAGDQPKGLRATIASAVEERMAGRI